MIHINFRFRRVKMNGLLVRIFGCRKEEVTGEWKKLHKEDGIISLLRIPNQFEREKRDM